MTDAPTETDLSGDGDSSAPGADEVLPRGAPVGRYIVLDKLGAGGMGVVYAAYDPELDRKLAIKLVRADSDTGTRRTRLVREAQALARLDHPNVVAVHDVGAVGSQVFIAMELVAGGRTIATWLAEAPRTWREIVAAYLQAGHGLVAAHALGIVHRDFKPENVLIEERAGARDGMRVRVVDFGLARPASTSAADAITADDAAAGDTDPEGATPLGAPLTRTGALVGTAGYIAPELQTGDTRPASDQFSFCVAVWKGLYGALPFAGASASELVIAAERGELRKPPKSQVPVRVHRALVRGLASDPARRFPSMAELLAELEHARRPRSRVLLAALGVLALVGTGAVAMHRAPPVVCRGPSFSLAAWNAPARAALERAFAATGVSYAASAVRGVEAALDGYAGAWSAARTDACEATRVRGEQSDALLDLRMACLDRRAREVGALAEAFADADQKVVEKSLAAAQSLELVADCADTTALRAETPPPADPMERGRIAELRGLVAEARALELAGKFADAIAKASSLATAARDVHYRPLEAAALDVLGNAQRDAMHTEDAQQTLETAFDAALAARDAATAADAAAMLVRVVGYERSDQAGGEAWMRRADALLEARPDDRVRATLENSIGNMRFRESRYDESLEHHEKALALRAKLYGDASPAFAASLDNIGLVYDFKGEPETGSTYHWRALAIDEAALGSDHPTVAITLGNLASSLEKLGNYQSAREADRRQLAIYETTYGSDSTMVAGVLDALGTYAKRNNDNAQAEQLYKREVAIDEAKRPPGDVKTAGAYTNLASLYIDTDRYAEAKVLLDKALPVWLASGDRLYTSTVYRLLGHVAEDGDQHHAEARDDILKARAILEQIEVPDSQLLATTDAELGDIDLAAGDAPRAVVEYKRALAVYDVKPVDQVDRADWHVSLAKALWATGDHKAPCDHLSLALALYQQAGVRAEPKRKDAEAWLAAHR